VARDFANTAKKALLLFRQMKTIIRAMIPQFRIGFWLLRPVAILELKTWVTLRGQGKCRGAT